MSEAIEVVQETTQKESLPALYTDKEVAAYLKLAPKWGYVTVQLWAREGKIRGVKVGDHWRFTKAAIDDFTSNKK